MKKIGFVFLLSALSSLAFSQNTAWDSLRVPDIYDSRVELFRAIPSSGKDIVFLGNSITFWAEWDMLLKSKRIKNQGIPGDTSFGVLRRLEEAAGGKPSKVFILIGINDLGRNIPDSVILRNYGRIVRGIKERSPRTRIYLQTILPTNETFEKLNHLYRKEANIAYLNSKMKEMADKEGITWVDLHTHFTDEQGMLKQEYTWDGVHLTLAGYRKWAEVLDAGGYLKARPFR